MTRTFIVVAFLSFIVVAAARAQIPVITNADLGKPVKQQIAMTPAQWQSFVDHQFKYIPPARPDYGGPRVGVSGWTSPTAEALSRPTYPLQPPFYMSTYVGPTIGIISLRPDGHRPRR